MRFKNDPLSGGSLIRQKIDKVENRYAGERRVRPRLLFENDPKAKIFFSSKGKKPFTVKIHDLSGGGLSFHAGRQAPALNDVEKVAITYEDRKLATKKIRKVNLIPLDAQGERQRISLLFEEENFKYYIPRDDAERINDYSFKIKPGKNPIPLIKSLLGCGTVFQDRRSHPRLRLSISENISVFLRFDSTGEELYLKGVADVSPLGLSLLIGDLRLFEPPRGLPDELSLMFERKILIRKEIRKIGISPVTVGGALTFKVRFLFSEEAGFNLPFETCFVCEDGQHRLKGKSLLPMLLLAMAANNSDVRISIPAGDALTKKIYQLRFKAYLQEGKIDPADYPSGEIADLYDERSIHLTAQIHSFVVAAARITLDGMYDRLDIEGIYKDKITRENGLRYAEVSRLCVDPFFRKNVNRNLDLLIALFIETYRICLDHLIDRILITTYQPHIAIYQMLGFRPVTPFLKIPGFHFEYTVMECNTTAFENVAVSLRPLFLQVYRENPGRVPIPSGEGGIVR